MGIRRPLQHQQQQQEQEQGEPRLLALDCEMVQSTADARELVKLAVVGADGAVLYHVRTTHPFISLLVVLFVQVRLIRQPAASALCHSAVSGSSCGGFQLHLAIMSRQLSSGMLGWSLNLNSDP